MFLEKRSVEKFFFPQWIYKRVIFHIKKNPHVDSFLILHIS